MNKHIHIATPLASKYPQLYKRSKGFQGALTLKNLFYFFGESEGLKIWKENTEKADFLHYVPFKVVCRLQSSWSHIFCFVVKRINLFLYQGRFSQVECWEKFLPRNSCEVLAHADSGLSLSLPQNVFQNRADMTVRDMAKGITFKKVKSRKTISQQSFSIFVFL